MIFKIKTLSLLAAGLAALFIATPLSAANPDIREVDGKTYNLVSRENSSGNLLWRSRVSAQLVEYQGETYIYFLEEGEEPPEQEKERNTWVSSGYSYLDGRPYWIKMTLYNSVGDIVENVEKYYDRENKKVISTVNGVAEAFDLKEEIYDKQNIVVFLMNYPFEEAKNVDFFLMTHEPATYKINAEFKGKETLTIDGEEIECYKLEMQPDLGLLNFIRVFIPRTCAWFETKPPHMFVRYEGLESGLRTPYVTIELVR